MAEGITSETEPLHPSHQARGYSDGRPAVVLIPDHLRDMDNDRYYDSERMNVWIMSTPNFEQGVDVGKPSTSNYGATLPPPPPYSSDTLDDDTSSSFYILTPQMVAFAETVNSLMWFLFAILLVSAIAIICISYQSPGISSCLGTNSWNAIQAGYALLFISAVVPNICHVLWIQHEPRPLVKDAVYFAATVFYIATAVIIDGRLYLCSTLLAQVAFCFTTVSVVFTLAILVLLLYELFTVRCHTQNYF